MNQNNTQKKPTQVIKPTTILAFQQQINVYYPQYINNVKRTHTQNDEIQPIFSKSRIPDDIQEDEFKIEIEKRYQDSKVNSYYIFPRCIQSSEDSSESSMESLKQTGVYNLFSPSKRKINSNVKRLVHRTEVIDLSDKFSRGSFFQKSQSPNNQNDKLYHVDQRVKTEGNQFDDTITIQQLKQSNRNQSQKNKIFNTKSDLKIDISKLGQLQKNLQKNHGVSAKYPTRERNDTEQSSCTTPKANPNLAFGLCFSIQAQKKTPLNQNSMKSNRINLTSTVHVPMNNKQDLIKSISNLSPLIKSGKKPLNLHLQNTSSCNKNYLNIGSLTDRRQQPLSTQRLSTKETPQNKAQINTRVKTLANDQGTTFNTVQELLKHFEKNKLLSKVINDKEKRFFGSKQNKTLAVNNESIFDKIKYEQLDVLRKQLNSQQQINSARQNLSTKSQVNDMISPFSSKPYFQALQKHQRNQTQGQDKQLRLTTENEDEVKIKKLSYHTNSQEYSNYFKRGKISQNKQ